jgi:hypothetical protein
MPDVTSPGFFLQFKNIDICYDFYCPCNPEDPQHVHGYFKQEFTCGSSEWDEDDGPEPTWCGKKWRLPHTISEGIEEITGCGS